MFKMGSNCSFGHLKHKLWPKEGSGVKLEKVGNWSNLLVCRQRATYRWKALDKGYNFALDHISIRGLLTKLWGSKVARVLTWVISGLPLGSPETKSHLDVNPVERCIVYYKGEGGGFPQVRAMVSLVCPCCSWFVLTPKVFQLRTNHLVWVLCRPMWVSEACQLFLVPSQSSSTPLYPSKCWLEWTSSHQCTNWGWARSTRFADEHPLCPSRFFFSPPSSLPRNSLPPPLLPTPSYLPRTTYQAHPPSPTSTLLLTTY